MGTRARLSLGTATLGMAIALMAPQAANAQDAQAAENEASSGREIIVTANMREQELSKVPASIAAFDEQALQNIGVAVFSDLINELPGVELRNNQAGRGSVAIRGISELNSGNLTGGTGSAVGIYIGEMPVTMAGFIPDLNAFDMARVEVLKGPQGTLYGEGSLAGTIRLIPNAPDSTKIAASFQGSLATIKGGEGVYDGNAMINLPIVEDLLAFRAVGFYQNQGGFIDNPVISGTPTIENANTNETYGGRFMLSLTPGTRFSALLTAMISDSDLGAPFIATNDLINTVSVPIDLSDKLRAYNATLEYKADGFTVTSSSSLFDRDRVGVRDQGGLVGGVNFVFGLVGVPNRVTGVFIDEDVRVRGFAQEIRAVSNGDGPFQWTVGAFYRNQRFNYGFVSDGVPSVPAALWQAIDQGVFGGLLQTSQGFATDTAGRSRQYAGFAEVSYDITSNFQILAGARIFEEKRNSTSSFDGVFPALQAALAGISPANPTFPRPGTFSTEADDSLVNPRVTLTYESDGGTLVYGTYSKGFRSGGQNDLFIFVPGSTQKDYESETLDNFELGIKAPLFDNRVRLQAALFHMKWDNLQAVVGEGTGGIGETIGNIGKAHSTGLDFEVTATPLPGLDLRVGATILEAETDVDTAVADPNGTGTIIVPSGTRIPGTARFSSAASATYRAPLSDGLDGFIRAAYNRTGGATSNLGLSFTRPALDGVPAFDVVDLRIGVEGKGWRLTAFADNLLNEDILFASVNAPDLGTGGRRFNVGRPRTIGIETRIDF